MKTELVFRFCVSENGDNLIQHTKIRFASFLFNPIPREVKADSAQVMAGPQLRLEFMKRPETIG